MGKGAFGRIRRCLTLVVVAMFMTLVAADFAGASVQSSSNVLIVNGTNYTNAGTLPTSGTVTGVSADSFDSFNFGATDQSSFDASSLSGYDTVVLNQVSTADLSTAQQQAIASFVTSGGKLIIHDADATFGNDYSWLPAPASSGATCENCGNVDGSAQVVENSALVSNDPSSASYVDVTELPGNTDAVGDANILVTSDPRWFADMRATNSQNVNGAVGLYASAGGLMIYNGFDTDSIGSAEPSGIDWLAKLWYQELAKQWNPDNLPRTFPAVGGGGGAVPKCARQSIVIGAVGVCADAINGTTASGNVVLDGGVAVGDGPISLDQNAGVISTDQPAPIGLLRSGGAVPLGSAAFSINATGITEPISGEPNVASIKLTAVSLGPLGTLKVGGLPVSLPTASGMTMYLDAAKGGGVIGSGSISLPLWLPGSQSRPSQVVTNSGALALGFFAGTPSPAIVLGGTVQLGKITFTKVWSFDGLQLAYQEPTDTWTASGGFTAPIGGLTANGTVVGGRLDSVHVDLTTSAPVPLLDSGFFFTNFGGGVSGLANGPLVLSASTGGFWGAPKSPVEPFYLKNVTLTVNFAGSVRLDGAVSFALKDGSPVTGDMHLALGLHPFSATGTVAVKAELPAVSVSASDAAGFTTSHFTALGTGELKVAGLSGKGQEVVSDAGVGGSGQLCVHFLGTHCQHLGFAATWKQIEHLDFPAIIGGDPQTLVTVPGIASATAGSAVRVSHGRRLLIMSVTGATGAPHVILRAPGGGVYDSANPRGLMLVDTQPQFRMTTITILRPRPGIWRISPAGPGTGPLRLHALTVHQIQPLHVGRVGPRGSRRHPLASTASFRVSWHSRGLPRGLQVVILRARRPGPHAVRLTVARARGGSGSLGIPVRRLSAGANYLTVVATLDGAPFQAAAVREPVWRASHRLRGHHH